MRQSYGMTGSIESSIDRKRTEFRDRNPIMAEHEHGTMDYSAQEKTYNGFVKFATRTGIVIIVALIVLTLVNG